MKYYLPELDYAFNDYWTDRGDVTITHVNLPVLSRDDLNTGTSIFHLLFNNNFTEEDYNIYFSEVSLTSLPKNIIDRICSRTPNTKCYQSTSDETKTNLFHFTEEEISMFDVLLEYRTTGECDISNIDYENLTSFLSKLVFLYLDIVVNENFISVDTLISIGSTEDMLHAMFFLYVINETHKLLKSAEIVLENNVIDYHINRKVIRMTEEIISTNQFSIYNPVPASKDLMFVTYNGRKLDSTEFSLDIETDPTEGVVHLFPGISFTLDSLDVVVVEYYSIENVPPTSNKIATEIDYFDYLLPDYIEQRQGTE